MKKLTEKFWHSSMKWQRDKMDQRQIQKKWGRMTAATCVVRFSSYQWEIGQPLKKKMLLDCLTNITPPEQDCGNTYVFRQNYCTAPICWIANIGHRNRILTTSCCT